jgi:hypothetical protein
MSTSPLIVIGYSVAIAFAMMLYDDTQNSNGSNAKVDIPSR